LEFGLGLNMRQNAVLGEKNDLKFKEKKK